MGSSSLGDQNEPKVIGKHSRIRPLRTYSKRTSSTDVADPASKKRRVEEINTTLEPKVEVTESARQSSATCPSPTLPPTQFAKKGTIMSYFKIVQPAPSSLFNSSGPVSGPVEPASTPPSSPPMSDFHQKNRRRLTTRIISQATSDDPSQKNVVEGEDEEKDQKSDETDEASEASVSPMDVQSDTSLNTLNRSGSTRENRLEARKRGRNKKENSKPSVVQTTLSLSISEKGFTECKECDMLYNPLHKQDAKYHAKRHAAMLKAKSTSQDNEISD
ncbi:hypothetical protein F4781DRAFT_364709 [Annulohypoxylon bovei var. microspora]|nr:hypothetical protein F4781DRAFT_364709 [Annulohypoxylon bovei var. microspora]